MRSKTLCELFGEWRRWPWRLSSTLPFMLGLVLGAIVCFATPAIETGLAVAATATPEPVEPLTTVAVTLRVVDADGNPVPESATPREVTLYLPFIGGAWFAEAREAAGIRKYARVGDRLRFELSALRARVGEMARPWPEGAVAGGLHVTPSDARFVHFGAASAHEDGRAFADRTLFLDAATKDRLLLIYADRACRIRGDETVDGLLITYAVDLPEAGFYWARVAPAGKGRRRLTVESTVTEVMLGLQVVIGSDGRPGGLSPGPGLEDSKKLGGRP